MIETKFAVLGSGMRSTSPSASSCVSMRAPLNTSPLVEPTSTMRCAVPTRSSRAWRPDTNGAAITTLLSGRRPTVTTSPDNGNVSSRAPFWMCNTAVVPAITVAPSNGPGFAAAGPWGAVTGTCPDRCAARSVCDAPQYEQNRAPPSGDGRPQCAHGGSVTGVRYQSSAITSTPSAMR